MKSKYYMMMVLVVFSGVPVCMYHNNNKLLLLITYMIMVLVVFSGVPGCVLIIIIMYIYHALINALSTHMIHINLNMIFYTHIEHSPTKTIYIKYYNFFYF